MLLNVERVQKSITRLRKFLKKQPGNPSPETIHDVRTSTRRLESSLEALEIGKNKLKKRLERNLSVLRKRLGKVRDMDVLTAHVMSITPKTPEPECLVQLLEYLGAKRSKYASKLQKVAKNYGPQLRDDLATIAENVTDAATQSGQNGEPAVEFDAQGAVSLEELLSELDRPARLNRRTLHPYRLKVKELRYVLQLSEDSGSQEFAKKLGEAKDAIGEWHDWEELLEAANKVVNGRPHSKLLRQLRIIADEKFNKALAITQRMRKTYRSAKRRQLLA
jgi:CHAD domain-containing protein